MQGRASIYHSAVIYEFIQRIRKEASSFGGSFRSFGFKTGDSSSPSLRSGQRSQWVHYDGKNYHMFCQWFPFGPKHGMKHWYHFISRDLSQWDADPHILIPDQYYEKNGCYSGNAWTDKKTGKTWLYYTANYKDKNLNKIPLQAAASIEMDGTLKKSSRNPIISGSPEGVGENIRDPFVFDYEGKTYMLIGAESAGESKRGMLLLYEMKDPETFQYLSEVKVLLNEQPLELGRMLECPGLITAGGKDLLFLSIIGDVSRKYSKNRFASVLLQGKFNPEQRVFTADCIQNADEGFDFYAPQPFYGKDQEPMMVGWFGNGDQVLPEDQEGWRHSLTIPRLLKLEDGIIKTPPVPQACSRFPQAVQVDLSLAENEPYDPQSVDHIHLTMKDTGKEEVFKVGSKEDFYTIRIDFQNHVLTLDRSSLKTAVDPEYGMSRSFSFEPGKEYEADLLIDHSFHELYWNSGEKVLSFRAYLGQSQNDGQQPVR